MCAAPPNKPDKDRPVLHYSALYNDPATGEPTIAHGLADKIGGQFSIPPQTFILIYGDSHQQADLAVRYPVEVWAKNLLLPFEFTDALRFASRVRSVQYAEHKPEIEKELLLRKFPRNG